MRMLLELRIPLFGAGRAASPAPFSRVVRAAAARPRRQHPVECGRAA